MSDRKPQPGDRVRVAFEAIWDQDRGSHYWLRDEADGTTTSIPAAAMVEVLEPADDPSSDPWGLVRRGPNGAIAIHMHVRRNIDGYAQGWRLTKGSVDMTDDQVVGWEVIGAVPGTPAAEQHMHNAGYCGTCNMVHDRREHVPPVATEEIDASTLFPPPVGTAPRVFKADGPEPPIDVRVLIDSNPDPEESSFAYLIRAGGGWCWSPSPELIAPDHGIAGPWSERADGAVGEGLREVLDA